MSLPAAPVTANEAAWGGLAGLRSSARAQEPAALRRAAQQFEALFTQQLLKSARAAKLGDDLMGGQQMDFYQDLFDQQMALHLSSGKGMGLADVLVRQLQGMGATGDQASDPGAGSSRLAPLLHSRGPAGAAPAVMPSSFIDEIRPHAERAARELGVPAEAILAQAALETGWGKSVPKNADGSSSHNYFGIKAHGWEGATVEKTTREFMGGRLQKMSAEFRSYDSPAAAFKDYVHFLKSNPRYVEALKAEDSSGFAQGLQKAGYATDPQYAAKLLKLAGSARIGGADGGLEV